MKVLLVGPFPPPHGGVSVHVAALRTELREAGARCKVVDLDPRRGRRDDPPDASDAPGADGEPERIRGGLDLVRLVSRYAREGYVVHLHTNGHNFKSWMIVLVCGLAARLAPSSVVTLHSGLLPSYLTRGGRHRRLLTRLACSLFNWTVCVNREIESTLLRIGVPARKLRLLPAFLPPRVKSGLLPLEVESWIGRHSPILSTTLFFRSEYGLDVLIEAVARLRREHPRLGCLVMGSGDGQEPLALLRRRGLYSAVQLAGDLPHDECVKAIARSDVFVRPTRADGDSISVREALSLGIPTVASRVGTRPEGIHLFPVGDVDALVFAIQAALRQRRPSIHAGGDGTLRRLLDLYQNGTGRPFSTAEWITGLGSHLTRTTGIPVYARTKHRD